MRARERIACPILAPAKQTECCDTIMQADYSACVFLYYMDTFTEQFIRACKPGGHILDLGAHVGKYSATFADRDFLVTAVDHACDDPGLDGVRWAKADIKEWLPTFSEEVMFYGIFMRNILQFFSAEYATDILFPLLDKHLRTGGVIAIETFYADPAPSFLVPFASYWSAEKLKKQFSAWKVLHSKQYKEEREALKGGRHLFRITDVIVKN